MRFVSVIFLMCCTAARAFAFDAAALPGGATTVPGPAHAHGQQVFAQPAANLDVASHRAFAAGRRVFHGDWMEQAQPGRTLVGLGPHFAARSCAACHVNDGRGSPDGPTRAVRLTLPAAATPAQRLAYGEQLTPYAVAGIPARGQLTVRWRDQAGRFADGSRYRLRYPVLDVQSTGYGPLPPGTQVSVRVAPQLAGVGLLDTISEHDIQQNERDQADRPGPVKGRASRVFEPFDGHEVVGRFGWKAQTGSLHHQVASALFHDMGVTSAAFPGPDATAPAELDTDTFLSLLNYQFGLGVPARRNATGAQVRRGEHLFARAQCAACHRPAYTTGKGWFPALSRQPIRPYTDLLLHDMGPGLADAGGQTWRTPPLWGVGLIQQVNGHRLLLHDGRARGVLEAVLWHGGEASGARQRVLRMGRRDREALAAFVNSL